MSETTPPEEPTEVTETTDHKKLIIIGAAVVAIIVAIIIAIVVSVYNSTPKVVYQPVDACTRLTLNEAKELLGDGAVLTTPPIAPVVNKNTALSRCGYTDGSADTNGIIVAAITVRSGVNDDGAAQNKTDFTNGSLGATIEAVEDVGDEAFFNPDLGQLNILDGRDWIILSYGVGSDPQGNTLEDAKKLAEKVLN
ncbi:MAG: hypothetical protein WAQ27_01805 [Candidatus Microsaccharimonas sp.]